MTLWYVKSQSFCPPAKFIRDDIMPLTADILFPAEARVTPSVRPSALRVAKTTNVGGGRACGG